MSGKYEITGRYSLKELIDHLEASPELCYNFITKVRDGLKNIKDVRLQKMFEQNETKLFYDFSGDRMQIGFRGK